MSTTEPQSADPQTVGGSMTDVNPASPTPYHAMVHQDPAFGYDPWPNEATRPTAAQLANFEEALTALTTNASVKTFTGADTIGADIGLLPEGLEMYASYVDNFGGYSELVKRFGATFAGLLLSITIFGNPARCADVEPGAMVASDLPHWIDFVALRQGGQLAWIYTSASNMSNCNAWVGGRHIVRFSAHYGFGPHVCGPHTCGWPQADWTQWTDRGPNGQNFDRSIGTYMPQQSSDGGIVRASGIYRALLEYDHDKGKLNITPQKGDNVKAGNFAESAHWNIGLELGGPHFGEWSGKSLPNIQG